MTWNLWLDDERSPSKWIRPDRPIFGFQDYPMRGMKAEDFHWARTLEEARNLISEKGPPAFMALDHDLGATPDGILEDTMMFLHWLEENYPNSCPEYNCHSSNLNGAANIKSFMNSWNKSLSLEKDE